MQHRWEHDHNANETQHTSVLNTLASSLRMPGRYFPISSLLPGALSTCRSVSVPYSGPLGWRSPWSTNLGVRVFSLCSSVFPSPPPVLPGERIKGLHLFHSTEFLPSVPIFLFLLELQCRGSGMRLRIERAALPIVRAMSAELLRPRRIQRKWGQRRLSGMMGKSVIWKWYGVKASGVPRGVLRARDQRQ